MPEFSAVTDMMSGPADLPSLIYIMVLVYYSVAGAFKYTRRSVCCFNVWWIHNLWYIEELFKVFEPPVRLPLNLGD